uniref:Tetraspanin n=1 Tax=Branchiostoma belcheri tsingtauense TaxID=155462 RepID=Q6W8Q0_BRABE|nr:CD63-like antigen [Branchiostoma belcheri tsingtauense]
MAVGFAMNCVKSLLILFNFMFWLLGVGLVAVGASIIGDGKIVHALSLTEFDQQLLTSTCNAMIAVGVIAILIGFLGCAGAAWENKCLLGAFLAIMGVLSLIEIIIGGVALANKHKAENYLKEKIDHISDRKYQNLTAEVKKFVDVIQAEMRCCGMKEVTDWAPDYPGTCNCTQKTSDDVHDGDKGVCDTTSGRWAKPCDNKILDNLRGAISAMAGMPIAVAFISFIGMVLAFVLFRSKDGGPPTFIIRGHEYKAFA